MRTAIQDGMADAWAELDALKKDEIDTGEVGSAQFFGTADDLKGKHLYRMAGVPLTGADDYTYHFAPGQLPPVNAFWSLTARSANPTGCVLRLARSPWCCSCTGRNPIR